jgi:hypothetical protein
MLKGALSGVRNQGTEAGKYLTPKALGMLKTLLGGAPLDPGRTFSAAEAERMTERLRRHYHHVVPFRRGRLEEIWDRCRGADCKKRRIRAEAKMGTPHGEFHARAGDHSRREDPERMSRAALSSIVDLPTPPTRRLVAR